MSDDADDRERAEAEALARALEDREGGQSAPGDAHEAAALLRYSGRAGELGSERAEALLAELAAEVAERAAPAPVTRLSAAGRGKRRAAAWGLGALAAAAAALLVVSLTQRATAPSTSVAEAPAPSAGGEPSLPSPSPRLLAAQAVRADKSGARDDQVFELEMQSYRARLLRALDRAYPTHVGRLPPRGPR